jgi:hypothetical protein
MDDDFWNQSDLTPEQQEKAGDHLVGGVLAIIAVFLIAVGYVGGRAFGWW